MLLLLDQHEPQWDSIVSEHVLANHQQVGSMTRLSAQPNCLRFCGLPTTINAKNEGAMWKLRNKVHV